MGYPTDKNGEACNPITPEGRLPPGVMLPFPNSTIYDLEEQLRRKIHDRFYPQLVKSLTNAVVEIIGHNFTPPEINKLVSPAANELWATIEDVIYEQAKVRLLDHVVQSLEPKRE